MQEKILIIQTDNIVTKALDSVLTSKYQVITKDDGLEAIEWLDQGNFADLIIADANMPYLDSFDFIREIRTRVYLKHTSILVVSDLDHVTDRSLYIRLGANDFLVKPFTKAQLKQRIGSLLEATPYNSQETAA